MFSRIKWIVLACCAFLLAGSLLLNAHRERQLSPQLALVSEADLAAILAEQSPSLRRAYSGELTIMGLPAPYDEAAGVYYLPQPLSGAFTGEGLCWSDPDYTVYAAIPEGFDKGEWIASGRLLTLAISDGDGYQLHKLALTGMAMLSIRTEKTASYILEKGLPAGYACVFTPAAGEASGVRAERLLITHRVRGQISRTLPKVSYRLTLYERSGRRMFVPLLGMGESDEWILNAMYSEPQRIRDKLSLDLWNRIAETNPVSDPPGAESAYTELVFDGAYLGLYLLTRPIGERTLALTEGEILYKTASWTVPTPADILLYADTLGSESTGVSIKWPKKWTSETLWDPLIRYLSLFYVDGGLASASEGLALLDAENAVDYALFYQAVSARDNYFSNTYLLFRPGRDGGGRIYKIPWDLNYSFGNVFTSLNGELFRLQYENAADTELPPDMQRLLAVDEGTVFAGLSARYKVLRQTVFSDEALLRSAESLSAELTQSGAIFREAARWSEGKVETEAEALYGYIKTHMAALDGYYGLGAG